MGTIVLVTDDFRSWYEALDLARQIAVERVVILLEERGVRLDFPYSSAIAGSRHALRELRVQAGGQPLRVLYAFDPARQAVLLIGGNKAGDDRFYRKGVPRADALWEQYLRAFELGDTERSGHGGG